MDLLHLPLFLTGRIEPMVYTNHNQSIQALVTDQFKGQTVVPLQLSEFTAWLGTYPWYKTELLKYTASTVHTK